MPGENSLILIPIAAQGSSLAHARGLSLILIPIAMQGSSLAHARGE
jgi:hypothetical protein